MAFIPANLLASSQEKVIADNPQKQNYLTELQKEALDSIREITLQLILIAVGVFAVVGGLVAGKEGEKGFRHRWAIVLSFLGFCVSIASGLLVYGKLIYDLYESHFHLRDLQSLSIWQWVSFAISGILLVFFFILNVNKRTKK
jgi:ABC-type sulfate transport system permease subunit